MAFDTRFAMVLVGSSGEGGAKLHRRNFGEAVENLTGSGEYHWMAGNFLKYGASEATFGSKNAGDLPVDAHELIALCAPRLTFISYGIPEKGDAKWLDQQGSFMAAVAAQPVFRLLGAKDLGVAEDYRNAKMPPVNDGPARRPARLASARRRPHRRPELEALHPWADKFIGHHRRRRSTARGGAGAGGSARAAHRRQLDDRARSSWSRRRRRADRRLLRRRLDHPALGRDRLSRPARQLDARTSTAGTRADFGWGADRTQNILWRIENGELDGVNPKVIVRARRHEQRRGACRRRRQGRRHHARPARDRRRLPPKGAGRDDHPDGASSRATTTWP